MDVYSPSMPIINRSWPIPALFMNLFGGVSIGLHMEPGTNKPSF